MERCKSLCSLKSFLYYALQLCGAIILCFHSILSSLRAHQLTIQSSCNCWWLWYPLFTDIAENTPFLKAECHLVWPQLGLCTWRDANFCHSSSTSDCESTASIALYIRMLIYIHTKQGKLFQGVRCQGSNLGWLLEGAWGRLVLFLDLGVGYTGYVHSVKTKLCVYDLCNFWMVFHFSKQRKTNNTLAPGSGGWPLSVHASWVLALGVDKLSSAYSMAVILGFPLNHLPGDFSCFSLISDLLFS